MLEQVGTKLCRSPRAGLKILVLDQLKTSLAGLKDHLKPTKTRKDLQNSLDCFKKFFFLTGMALDLPK